MRMVIHSVIQSMAVRRSILLFGILFIFAVNNSVSAQEEPVEMAGAIEAAETTETMRGFRRRTVIIDINVRLVEREQVVVWNETHRRVSIPGSPVGIKLVGSNVVVEAQFTAFVRRHGNVLVAHGQIWYNNPNGGISYYTSIQTIPMEFNEPIHFFPLGQAQDIDSSLEIIIVVNPNTAAEADENAVDAEAANTENEN